MRLSIQLLCMAWIATISIFFCSGTPISSSGKTSNVSLTGTSIHSPTIIEPAESYEDEESEQEIEGGATEYEEDNSDIEEAEEEGKEEADQDKNGNGEPSTGTFFDFDDSDDLEVLAKGILGSNDNKESVVPCFGTWWPSSGGYVYYYEDYGNGGTDTVDEGGEYGGDYGRRRRNRRMKRKRMRRNRAKRARTSKKAAKKKA